MGFLYLAAIHLYKLLTTIASLFNNKAKLRITGINKQKNTIIPKSNRKTIWFHCASLGEFEQARPIIEEIKTKNNNTFIVISFFSPSGYEIMKNYKFANYICYLPFDTPVNAEKFIQNINPDIAIFVKYEFWYYFLKTLNKKNITTYLISGIFREEQMFFKKHGGFYRKILNNFTHLFVQNLESKKLLEKINITNVTITGDTRFDRVFKIAKKPKDLSVLKNFKKNNLLFIAGSTWAEDENIISSFINSTNKKIKYIIAPHQIEQAHIKKIQASLKVNSLKYSEINNENIHETNIIIVDNIGLLSSLYSIADIAYIGGGFGAGIHNTLEAAVFGIPIIIGPKYQKFNEAVELIERQAAFCIKNNTEFEQITNNFIKNEIDRLTAGGNALHYVEKKLGASKKILDHINM